MHIDGDRPRRVDTTYQEYYTHTMIIVVVRRTTTIFETAYHIKTRTAIFQISNYVDLSFVI